MPNKKDFKLLGNFICKIIIYSWYTEVNKMKLFFNYIVGSLSTVCDGINVVGCY